MKKIAIVILNYKNIADTLDCIASLEKVHIDDFSLSIILVNNDTENTYTLSDFKTKFPLEIINNPINNGFSGGNNVGIKKALLQGVEYVLLLNNDTLVDPSFVKELVKSANLQPNSGALSPKIYFAKGCEFHKTRYTKEELGKVLWYAGGLMDWRNVIGTHRGVDEVDKGQYDEESTTDFVTGCCMLIPSDVLKKIGILDERYFLYYEDSDLSERIKRAGFSLSFVSRAIIWHKNGGAAGGSGSSLQDYYISRNRLLFGMTYAPMKSKIALVRESLSILLRGRKWQKTGVKDFYLRKFGKGSYFTHA